MIWGGSGKSGERKLNCYLRGKKIQLNNLEEKKTQPINLEENKINEFWVASPRKKYLYGRGSQKKINSFRKFPPAPQIINGRPLTFLLSY